MTTTTLTTIDCPRCDGRGEYYDDKSDVWGTKPCLECEPSGVGHQLQATAREYDSIKSSLELCLRIAVEQKEVRIGDINYINMISLIEKYDILATKEQDIYNSRS